MWLLTRYGSYRISSAGQTATVRARRLAHLKNLRKRFPELTDAEIVTAPDGGYRLIVSQQLWSAVMVELAQEQESGRDREGVPLFISRAAQLRLIAAACALALIWINAYVCRQVFFIEYTGKMNSMHGFWIAMAKLATVHWYKPYWWPHWYLGMPFEYTYAPLVPGLTAAIARLEHISAARAFQIVSGSVYCFGPVALFLMARQLTRRTVYSFIAAVVYSLAAASEMLLPDSNYSVQHWGDARRLYLCFVWDEVPHQLGLALVCLAILFLARALHDRKFRSFVWAGVFVSLSLLASAFGATVLLLFAGSLLATCETAALRRNVLLVSLCGLLGYLAMCPYFPPSLMRAVRTNAQLFPNMQWTAGSFWAFMGVAGIGALLWFVSRRWHPWYLRFFLLLAYLTFVIPALEEKWQLHFIPQGGRYKVELELTLVLLIVFAAALLIDRLPRLVQGALALLLIWPVSQQVIAHRRFSKNVIQPADITQTIEYQVARWVEPNLPGWRVTAPGSIAQWLNAFSKVAQFTGGSFPTAPNPVQLHIGSDLISTTDATVPPLWYKAYGVDAVIVAGRDSPEFWRPHPHGHQFDGVFPLLWDERDTQIYAVPRARTLAHVISQDSLVSRTPASLSDMAQLARYVAAMENADIIPARFQWLRDGRARIHADLGPKQVLSVQVTYHPGWKAKAAGRPIPIAKDALGQIVLTPDRPGAYDIELLYGADWEGRLCRILSIGTLLGVAIVACRRRWRKEPFRAAI